MVRFGVREIERIIIHMRALMDVVDIELENNFYEQTSAKICSLAGVCVAFKKI